MNNQLTFLVLRFLENESDIIHLKMKVKCITLVSNLEHKG